MDQKEFNALMKRARWDRIGGAFAALVILIVLIVCIASACGKKKETEPADANSVITPVSTEAVTEPPVDNSMAVYLSPSTQIDNVYACDETVTERSAMFDLANKVKTLLETDGFTVYMCGEDDNVKSKVEQGNELKCGAYVALHSNAGGESGDGQGTECYYNAGVPGSQALAENVYNRVADATPTEDRGLKDQTQRDLYEILKNESPCCLIEVEFHNQTDLSQWILDNQDTLAKAVKDGIEAYLNGTVTAPAETVSTEAVPGTETVGEDLAE